MKKFFNSAAFIVILFIVAISVTAFVTGIFELYTPAVVLGLFLPTCTWQEGKPSKSKR